MESPLVEWSRDDANLSPCGMVGRLSSLPSMVQFNIELVLTAAPPPFESTTISYHRGDDASGWEMSRPWTQVSASTDWSMQEDGSSVGVPFQTTTKSANG